VASPGYAVPSLAVGPSKKSMITIQRIEAACKSSEPTPLSHVGDFNGFREMHMHMQS
jgi:hypothetical protein